MGWNHPPLTPSQPISDRLQNERKTWHVEHTSASCFPRVVDPATVMSPYLLAYDLGLQTAPWWPFSGSGVEVPKSLTKNPPGHIGESWHVYGIFLICFRGLFGCSPCFFVVRWGRGSITGGNWRSHFFVLVLNRQLFPLFEWGCDIPNWPEAKWVFESLKLEHMDGTEPCHKPINEFRADARFQFLKHLPSTVQDQDCQKTSPWNRKPYYKAIWCLLRYVTKHARNQNRLHF